MIDCNDWESFNAGLTMPPDREAQDFLKSRQPLADKLNERTPAPTVSELGRNIEKNLRFAELYGWSPSATFRNWRIDPPYSSYFIAVDPAAPPAPKTIEQRVAEVERKTQGHTTLALADDRAARAHKRITALETGLLTYQQRDLGDERVQDSKIADLTERIADLEARTTAIETPKTKARKARAKAKRK